MNITSAEAADLGRFPFAATARLFENGHARTHFAYHALHHPVRVYQTMRDLLAGQTKAA